MPSKAMRRLVRYVRGLPVTTDKRPDSDAARGIDVSRTRQCRLAFSLGLAH